MTSFVNTFTFKTNIIAAPGQVTTAKSGVLIGHRTTSGDLILANSGYSQPNLYQPIPLAPFTSGGSALAYMQNLGFNVSYGIPFNLSLPAPSSVSALVNGQYTLTWNTIPSNFYLLTQISLNGTITQLTNTGTVISASINNLNQAIMIIKPISLSTFDTINPITLAGINNNNYPNPALTDEICMMVWYYYQTAPSLPTSPNGQPMAYISVLSDRDTTHSPNSTPFTLAAPTTETPSGSTVILTYPTTAANLGYLPLTALGNTTFTQATSTATGTYNGMTISNGTVSITLVNVTGTFDLTHTISVVLDSSQNVFTYLESDSLEINNVVSPYEITSSSQYTTYSDFITGIETLNNGTFITQNKYFVEGIFGNIDTTAINASTLPNTLNSQIFKQVSYPYAPMFLDIPFAASSLASVQAYVDNNVDAPYPPQDGVYVLAIPISSNTQNKYSVVSGGSADVAINQGWTPWGINSNGQVYIIRDVTTLVTIPNTNITDVEFRFEHVWDVVRYITKDIYQQWQVASTSPIINGGRVFNSPFFQSNFKNIVISRLYLYQTLGMIENVASYASLVSVITNPSSPTGIIVTIPAQIIPGLGSANVTLNIFSVFNVFTTTA